MNPRLQGLGPVARLEIYVTNVNPAQNPRGVPDMLSTELANYHLTCLICWETEEIITPEYPGQSGPAALQEHFIEVHHIPRSQLEAASRQRYKAYRYRLLDGRYFLLAVEDRTVLQS